MSQGVCGSLLQFEVHLYCTLEHFTEPEVIVGWLTIEGTSSEKCTFFLFYCCRYFFLLSISIAFPLAMTFWFCFAVQYNNKKAIQKSQYRMTTLKNYFNKLNWHSIIIFDIIMSLKIKEPMAQWRICYDSWFSGIIILIYFHSVPNKIEAPIPLSINMYQLHRISVSHNDQYIIPKSKFELVTFLKILRILYMPNNHLGLDK